MLGLSKFGLIRAVFEVGDDELQSRCEGDGQLHLRYEGKNFDRSHLVSCIVAVFICCSLSGILRPDGMKVIDMQTTPVKFPIDLQTLTPSLIYRLNCVGCKIPSLSA